MPGTPVPEERKSRRDVFKALGVAAGGAVAGGMLLAKRAEAGHGSLNASTSGPNPAIHGDSTSSGNGLLGTSATGDAIRGDTSGTSSGAVGVVGRVVAFTGAAIGVAGSSSSPAGVGVFASGATALQVSGRAKFSTSGAGTIPMDQISAALSNASVKAVSHITVTLTGDPGKQEACLDLSRSSCGGAPTRNRLRRSHVPARAGRHALHLFHRGAYVGANIPPAPASLWSMGSLHQFAYQLLEQRLQRTPLKSSFNA